MLCDICGKNQATVHLTEIVDDQMAELHLCEACARQKSENMEQQFGLGDFMAGLVDIGKPAQEKEDTTLKCKKCGLVYSDFKKIGRLGCSECYAAFKKHLGPLLKRIHGSTQHLGKVPLKETKVSGRKVMDLNHLKEKLQKAIEIEAFEEAARLRDLIKELEKKQSQEK